MANTHGFFAGCMKSDINTNPTNSYSNGGYNVFCSWDENGGEGSGGYAVSESGTHVLINTPNVSTVGSYSQAANNATAGDGIIIQNGGALKDTQAAGFMGGVNDGDPPSNYPYSFWFLGTIGFEKYNNLEQPAGFNTGSGILINSFQNDGMRPVSSMDPGAPVYTTAGVSDVTTATDYTVCICAGDINGVDLYDNSGCRITFRFSSTNLASGLSNLAYYYPLSSAYGLGIDSTMNDENAAARWLLNGYPILQNGEPVFWDNAN
jgi:hypothetical protein|tara:strand:+ start:641 stop:1429 length:789 start_codon:yes stop_codon:yes gene_type:complete